MSQQVITTDADGLKKVASHYAGHQVDRKAPGVVFAAKLPDVAVTAYKSGKVLFQGAGSAREAAKWGGGVVSAARVTAKKPAGETLPEDLATLSVIGSDETGTGDFFGPVTVCACYVRKEQIPLVQELGVKDSKLLNDEYMRKIAPDLKAALVHSVLTLPNVKYNEVQGKGYSAGKIKALLHNQAIRQVLKKLGGEQPNYILIDQFAERGVYYNHVKAQKEIIRENVLFSTKAEGLHVAVAAASIIARFAFLEEMDRLSRIAGFPLPKGAGPKVDEAAAKILLAKGDDFLRSMTKHHFANTSKAKRLAEKKYR